MNQLPTEVLHKIFILLHYQDKVECMLVCHHWKNIIKTFSLFHTIRVTTLSGLLSLKDKIMEDRIQASKIERLIFNLCPNQNIAIIGFLSLFLNLRVLFFDSAYSPTCDEMHDNLRLSKNIKHISGFCPEELTYKILHSSVFPQLTTLSIICRGRATIEQLKNAPALKSLEITNASISIDELELIHKYAVSLTSFHLKNVRLIDNTEDHEVTPATQITNFGIVCITVYHGKSEIKLLKYIKNKYPKVLNFSYGKNEGIESGSDTDTIVYETGMIPIYQNLCSQLNSLHLTHIRDNEIPFDILDSGGCELDDVSLGLAISSDIILQLAQSNQAKYIQTLTLDSMKYPESFEWLKSFKQLKTLSMNLITIRRILNLNDIVTMCPSSLKSLSLEKARLNVAIEDDETVNPTCIERLTFTSTKLPDEITDYISKKFLHLLHFKLKGCNLRGQTLSLPNLNLLHFELQDEFSINDNNVLVLSLVNNRCRMYTTDPKSRYSSELLKVFGPHDAPVFPPMKSLPEPELKSKPFFTLVCHSIKNVIVSQLNE